MLLFPDSSSNAGAVTAMDGDAMPGKADAIIDVACLNLVVHAHVSTLLSRDLCQATLVT
jgi:hypothetical protein